MKRWDVIFYMVDIKNLYHYVSHTLVDEREKRKVLKFIKKEGYTYDRKLGWYVKPIEGSDCVTKFVYNFLPFSV